MFTIKDLNEYLVLFLDIESHLNLIKVNKLFERTFNNEVIWKNKLKEKINVDNRLNYKGLFIQFYKVDKFVDRIKKVPRPFSDTNINTVDINHLVNMERNGLFSSINDKDIYDYMLSFTKSKKNQIVYEYLKNEMIKYRNENTSLLLRCYLITPIIFILEEILKH